MYPAAIGWVTHHAVSGIFAGLILRGAAKAAPVAKPTARKMLVNGMAGGIVAGRWLGSAAEEARLKTGDLLAEAQGQLGEAATPPQGASRQQAGAARGRRWGANMNHEH